MKGSETFVNAKINHTFFKNDSLVFQFENLKGHQNGETMWDPGMCIQTHMSQICALICHFLCKVLPICNYLWKSVLCLNEKSVCKVCKIVHDIN